ncbi:MAG: ATP-binding protein [Armatimonadota bacterium]
MGQEEAVRVLRGALASGHVSHAYLFYGPPGTGKSLTADIFARAVNCELSGDDSCDRCSSCLRSMHGNHPDVHVLTPGSEKGENVGIQQMREMRSDVYLRPRFGRRKVYIVPEADRLSPPACHTVLKTLEEPPPYVTIILIAPDLAEILPTVISRCQLIRFTPEPLTVVQEALMKRGIPEETAVLAAAYCEGRVGAAIRFASDSVFLSRRAKVLDILLSANSAPRAAALKLAEDIQKLASQKGKPSAEPAEPTSLSSEQEAASDRESAYAGPETALGKADLQGVVDIALSWYRDLLVVRELGAGGPLRNRDRLKELQQVAAELPTAKIQDLLEFLTQARYYLERNANPRLVIEQLMLKIMPGW